MRVKYILILIYSTVIIISCKKDINSNSLDPFYRLTVNNDLKIIEACGTSDYVVQYLKDTAVFAAFGCGEQRAGFYLKGQISDGIYILDNRNTAWYEFGSASYVTDSINKGSLTIKSRTFINSTGGQIPIIEGEISFDATDKNTGQKIKVTKGTFLLKKFQY